MKQKSSAKDIYIYIYISLCGEQDVFVMILGNKLEILSLSETIVRSFLSDVAFDSSEIHHCSLLDLFGNIYTLDSGVL